MNRFPVGWTVKLAVGEARRLPATRFDALLAALRASPIEPQALRLQGWIIVASLVVPFLTNVAIVAGIASASRDAPSRLAAVLSISALIAASVYASSCLFSWLNAMVSANAIRARLAEEAAAVPPP